MGMYLPLGGSMHSSFKSVYSFYNYCYSSYATYEHESLVSIFEEGQVLELDQPDGDVVLVHEEAGEEHEWDDQNRGQGHCQLLVCEESGDNESIAAGCRVYQDQQSHYYL